MPISFSHRGPKKNGLVDRVLTAVSPALLIPNRAWLTTWHQRDTAGFLFSARVYFGGFALIYLAHLFVVDIPAHKEPLALWAEYRLGCAGANLFGFFLTYLPSFKDSVFKRVSVFVVAVICVYMQGKSMEWRAAIPSFYVPLIAAFGSLALRSSVVTSVAAFAIILIPSSRFYFIRPDQTHHMVSATLVSLAVLAVLRSRQKQDVALFISEQEGLEVQKSLIESQMQLVDQLRTFLPLEIYNRVTSLMQQYGKTPLQAADEILKPRSVVGTVLFTDIRGFTGLTKQGNETLLSAVIPAQKLCTDTVEKNHGIPKLQGDLVHAYYDLENPVHNLKNALISAIELHQLTFDLNTSLTRNSQIKRYVIITHGDLLVGNLGGSEGSCDISALGDAANLPSRIDPMTKGPEFSARLESHPIILSESAWKCLQTFCSGLEAEVFNLSSLDLSIRDFPDETRLHLLRASRSNLEMLIGGVQPISIMSKRPIESKGLDKKSA